MKEECVYLCLKLCFGQVNRRGRADTKLMNKPSMALHCAVHILAFELSNVLYKSLLDSRAIDLYRRQLK